MHQYSTDAVGQAGMMKGSVIDVEPQPFAPTREPRTSPQPVALVAGSCGASARRAQPQSVLPTADPVSALEALATRKSASRKPVEPQSSRAPVADPFAALEDLAARRSTSKGLVGQSSPRVKGMLAQLPQIDFEVARMVPARVREVQDVTISQAQDDHQFLRGVRPPPIFGEMHAVFEEELQANLSRKRCGAGAEAGVLLHALHCQDVHARGRVSIEAVCLARNVANHARSDAAGSGSWRDSVAGAGVLERPRSTMKNVSVLPSQGANATGSRRLSRNSEAGDYQSPTAFGKARANVLASQSWMKKLPQSNKISFQ